MKYHYTYKIVNKVNNKYYLGVHNTDDINDGYMGSGKALLRAYKKYGRENFEKIILEFFQSKEEAFAAESELITQTQIDDPKCYNMTLGGYGNPGKDIFTTKNRIVVHKENTIKYIYECELPLYEENGWEKGNPLSGHRGKIVVFKNKEKKYIHESQLQEYIDLGWNKKPSTKRISLVKNGESIQVFEDEIEKYLVDGWVKGMSRDNNYLHNVWMHNEIEQKRIPLSKVDEFLKNGWIRGRLKMNHTYIKRNWVEKDGLEKCILHSELQTYLENGWVNRHLLSKEFTTSNTKWMNNSNERKPVKIEDIPEYLKHGWVLGYNLQKKE